MSKASLSVFEPDNKAFYRIENNPINQTHKNRKWHNNVPE